MTASSFAHRRGRLCIVASPDPRRGPLKVNVVIYSAVLSPGQHIIHELLPESSVWLHVVRGETAFGHFMLRAGDGVCAHEERAISFTANEPSEVLFLVTGR